VKLTNETKVGILAISSLTFLVLGFYFLKGKSLFGDKMTLYAKYSNVAGLTRSCPVIINGLQIGNIAEIKSNPDMRSFIVVLTINQKVNIPDNSVANIQPSPLTSSKLEIQLGNSTTALQDKDTIVSLPNQGIIDNLMQKVDPVIAVVKTTIGSLDTILESVNRVLSNNSQRNINATLENINKLSASLLASSQSLQNMLNNQNGVISSTLNNMNSFSKNLSNNNEKVTSVLDNLDKTTSKLSKLELENTINNINTTIQSLQAALNKINAGDGTLGLLLNDKTLYKNLTASSNKLNTLLDDVRVHPKRYVSISVFGGKTSTPPLKTPLPDTLNAPYQ
jgi:phospholipid/cholesterol/gamma-HCH transport system substrate-binding protein